VAWSRSSGSAAELRFYLSFVICYLSFRQARSA
jgi:hypothetical protein